MLPEEREWEREAWERFDKAMTGVMAVSHTEIQRRIEAERQRAALNPNRRGPKPKKPCTSPAPAGQPTV